MPVKTILNRPSVNDRHDATIAETRPEIVEIQESPTLSSLFCTPSGTPPTSRPPTPFDNHARLSKDNSNSRSGEIGRRGHGSRSSYNSVRDSTGGPPINAPKGSRAPREDLPNKDSYSGGGHAQIEERLRALEADNYRYQAEQRRDRNRVLELEEQISLLKEQQDRKLRQEIYELKKTMNHAINQTISR